MTTPQTYGPNENLTLDTVELGQYAGQGWHGPGRYFCPVHGSDRQKSLQVAESGRFTCFSCGAWGFMDWAREDFKRAHQHERPQKAPVVARTAPKPKPQPETRPGLSGRLRAYMDALEGSPGEAYLRSRGVPLDVARQYGLGWAPGGVFSEKDRQPRVVVPHTAPGPEGKVKLVSLYGRALSGRKEEKHRHLPGAKGYFNARALTEGEGPLVLCEGAFDALSFIVAGHARTVACFGVQGIRWDWFQPGKVSHLVFAFDADEAGQTERDKAVQQALALGFRVAYCTAEDYGGLKDANEALVAGKLDVSGLQLVEIPF